MTGSSNNVFTVTIQKNGITLNTFKQTVTYQGNVQKWNTFRSALNAVRGDVNNFLTEEVAKQNQQAGKRASSDEESDTVSSKKKQKQM